MSTKLKRAQGKKLVKRELILDVTWVNLFIHPLKYQVNSYHDAGIHGNGKGDIVNHLFHEIILNIVLYLHHLNFRDKRQMIQYSLLLNNPLFQSEYIKHSNYQISQHNRQHKTSKHMPFDIVFSFFLSDS